MQVASLVFRTETAPERMDGGLHLLNQTNGK